MITERARYSRSDWAAAAVLFLASAAVVIWQNSRLTVLWDASYILENASRIAAGDVPYRDFPFPYAPLTFALQALIIRLFGRVFWHHIAYAAMACGAASALTYFIARRLTRPSIAFLLSLPLALLGINCIYPHPFYDPDTCLAVLAIIALLRARNDSLLAGALCVVPLLIKQNIGIAFLAAAVLLYALARCWRTVAGAAIGVAAAVLLIALIFGAGNYVRWTIHFAAARRLPPLSDLLGMFAEPVIWWWAAAIAGGAYLARRWRWPGAALMIAPFVWMVLHADDYEIDLLRLWPAVIIAALVVAPRRLTLLILATIGGAFLSQGNWGSTYGIWPLLVLLLVSIIERTEVAAIVAAVMLLLGWPYIVSNDRLTYAKWNDGPLHASTLPALRGLRMRGEWLPEFEQVVAFAEANIPRDDAILFLPGEDFFYFTTGRRPRVPVLMFDRTVNPLSPAQIAALPVHWVIVKRRLQLNGEPFPELHATLALLHGRLVARLANYDVYRR